MSTLFIVATPIGNLEDLTPRATRTLRDVPLVATEQIAAARRLLSHLGVRGKRLVTYNEHNRAARIPALLDHLAKADLALISVAGTPGVSDPGAELVHAAREAGHTVTPIPGANAAIAALSVSGLAVHSFTFLGFLPRSRREASTLLRRFVTAPEPLVLYEAPHRLHRTLELLIETFDDRWCMIGRELTKLYEETWSGGLRDALAHFATPRGEFAIVVGGAVEDESAPSEEPTAALVAEILHSSHTAREAVARLQEVGVRRRDAFRLWLDERERG